MNHGSFLLTLLDVAQTSKIRNYIHHKEITSIIKCGIKSFIHSQISMAAWSLGIDMSMCSPMLELKLIHVRVLVKGAGGCQEWHENMWVQVLFTTHWGLNKMVDILQTPFSNGFSGRKTSEFQIKFDWNIYLWGLLDNKSSLVQALVTAWCWTG